MIWQFDGNVLIAIADADYAFHDATRQSRPRPWRHVFWAEELSITDSRGIPADRIAGARQVTDVLRG